MEQQMQQLLDMVVAWGARYGAKAVVALIIFIAGSWLCRKIGRLTRKALELRGVDELLSRFIQEIVHYALLVAVIIAAIGQLGINTASFLAVLGTAGLAVGLALKDNLANFSSGVLLILLRPFTVKDYISVAGVAGSVQKITLTNTILHTPDNQKIIVPNSSVMGNVITNYTANATRRLDMVIGISYGDDIAKAKGLIEGILKDETRILPDPAPLVAVGELADSSVNIFVRPWVKKEDYWPTFFDLTERIKLALDENGITIPFPQRDVHIVSGEG